MFLDAVLGKKFEGAVVIRYYARGGSELEKNLVLLNVNLSVREIAWYADFGFYIVYKTRFDPIPFICYHWGRADAMPACIKAASASGATGRPK